MITHTTANCFTALVVQYLIESMVVAKMAWGAVSAAPMTPIHKKLKNQAIYLHLLNIAWMQRKKRMDVVGMHTAYIQEVTFGVSRILRLVQLMFRGLAENVRRSFY